MSLDTWTDIWSDIWGDPFQVPFATLWSARVRTPDLKIGAPVRFSSASLVENYNAPSMLSITGRLDNIRAVMLPGYGVVMRDDTGKVRFSGPAVDITVSEGGTGTVIFAGDMVKLWNRLIWPNPTIPWDSQTTEVDAQTGNAEDRILSYISRNAGPTAWHLPAAGISPGASPAFTVYGTTLNPTTDHHVIQTMTPDAATGDIYMTQAPNDTDVSLPDDLHIARFAGGVQVSTMSLPNGGHGDQMMITRREGKVYCAFRYRGGSLSQGGGTWVSLPYTAGKTWTAAQALAYKVSSSEPYVPGVPLSPYVPPKCLLPARAWCQGETFWDGKFYRTYGTPYDNAGSINTPAIPAFLEIIEDGVITSTVDLAGAGLGRIGMNPAANPIGGFLEPEGLAIVEDSGQVCLLIGYTVDAVGARKGVLYTWPLDPGNFPVEDRRIRGLTLPLSLDRGPAGTTTARPPDPVGQVVATLAESADLRIDIVQDDALPQLNLTISDAPDLTASIRIGTPEAGGPIMLGPGWFYRSAIHVTTTVLSVAGGEDDPLTFAHRNDRVRVGEWGERVESYVDQHGSTEAADIDEGMTAAMDEGIGPTEISVPLGRSALQFGTDVPLGARVSAVLDGKVITERIRQITTDLQKAEGEPSVTVTAVLGSPDAGITLTQKDIREMDRRLQKLERI